MNNREALQAMVDGKVIKQEGGYYIYRFKPTEGFQRCSAEPPRLYWENTPLHILNETYEVVEEPSKKMPTEVVEKAATMNRKETLEYMLGGGLILDSNSRRWRFNPETGFEVATTTTPGNGPAWVTAQVDFTRNSYKPYYINPHTRGTFDWAEFEHDVKKKNVRRGNKDSNWFAHGVLRLETQLMPAEDFRATDWESK